MPEYATVTHLRETNLIEDSSGSSAIAPPSNLFSTSWSRLRLQTPLFS